MANLSFLHIFKRQHNKTSTSACCAVVNLLNVCPLSHVSSFGMNRGEYRIFTDGPGNGRITNFISISQLFLCSLHNQEGLPFRPHIEVHGVWMLFRSRQQGQRDKCRERKDSPAMVFRKSRFICNINVTPVGKITFSALLRSTHLLP